MIFRILLACGFLAIPVGFVVFPFVSPVLSGKPILADPPQAVSLSPSVAPVAGNAGAVPVGNKPTLLIFTADWCPPCKMMKSQVYPSPQIVEISDRFNWVFVDVDKERQKASKYGARSIPHFVLEDASGKQIGSLSGGMDSASFRQFLLTAL